MLKKKKINGINSLINKINYGLSFILFILIYNI